MKKILLLFACLFITQSSFAYYEGSVGPEAMGGNRQRPSELNNWQQRQFETKQQAWDRQSRENYDTYRNNNYQAPLGGYNRPINDNGGRQYGYNW